MKINKSSWHYRLLSDNGAVPSRNLCTYFWQVMGVLLLHLIVLAFVIAAGVVALSAVALPIMALYDWEWFVRLFGAEKMGFFGTVAAVGIAGWAIAVLFASTYIPAGIREIRWRMSGGESKPSLVGSYIKAKKQRICPIIEFEDRS